MRGSDLSYPDWLQGEWQVSSELISVETPQGDALAGPVASAARKRLGTREAAALYKKRFVRIGEKIVNNRGFPSQPLLECLGGEGPALSAEWDGEKDPDVVALRLKRGSFTVAVNLRSGLRAGVTPEGRPDLFNVSELYLAATEAPDEVTPLREVTKFKRVDKVPGSESGGVQELIRFEVYAPSSASAASAAVPEQQGDSTSPLATFKYRCFLVRLPS